MKETHNEYDAITHLLKKTAWPTPSQSLAYRIQQAAQSSADTDVYGVPSSFWGAGSPALSFLAVAAALFLGITSGFITSQDAKAGSNYSNYYYETQETSLSSLYLGQNYGTAE